MWWRSTRKGIGCGQIKPHGADVFELASIAVHPHFRGQGVAKAIIQSLLASGPRPLYLMCRSSLQPFYEKFGFHSLNREQMPAYFRRIFRVVIWAEGIIRSGETLLVMARPE